MGIIERKIREKEERRKLILDRTKRLILEKGVDALSMQDIADAAELSKATLYLYFQSKEAILQEIVADATGYFAEYVEERIPSGASGLEALRTLWSSYLGIFGEPEDVLVLIGIMKYADPGFLFRKNAVRSPDAPTGRMLGLIARVLGRGVADGTLDPSIDPERVARTALIIATSVVDSIARLPRNERDAGIIQEEQRSTFELLLRGLASAETDRAQLVLASK